MRRSGRLARTLAPPSNRPRIRRLVWLAGTLSLPVLLIFGAVWWRHSHTGKEHYVARPAGTLTYCKDIAPIFVQQCATCHRPGQAAPFSLLSYEDVEKRARQIAEVTASRYMPPWMPEPGYAEFAGERRLTTEQLGMIQQWVTEGAREGNSADLPPIPSWSEGWQLGKPDLIVKMPEAYKLGPEGKDVYRNFVVPIPLDRPRYVRAMELNPGNWKVVHHAFIRFDRTAECRRVDAQDEEIGFPGIHTPQGAQSPEGHFVSWQPGKVFSQVQPGLSWKLETNTDLVLQAHLQPSGKPELVQPSVAFYFTDEPPTNAPMKIWLTSYDIDIPAGASNHVVTDSLIVPVDLDVLGVLPHSHYLAKQVEGIATLPDGSTKWLLKIAHWDFNWQGDYRYEEPIFLPKGTKITMRIAYDNSEANVANPSHPPKRVRYGLRTTDSMGELWFQVLPHSAQDAETLKDSNQSQIVQDTIAYNQYLLRENPNDAKAYSGLGKAMYFLERNAEAWRDFSQAARLDAKLEEPHYYAGLMLRRENRSQAAKTEFQTVLQLNPKHSRAAGNLGWLLLQEGNLAQAEAQFGYVLSLDPKDDLARQGLAEISRIQSTRAKGP